MIYIHGLVGGNQLHYASVGNAHSVSMLYVHGCID